MKIIYNILETLIPFEFINYTFMKNALIAIILVSPVFAILGTMIVNNKMAFFSDALGHSALTCPWTFCNMWNCHRNTTRNI